MSKKYYKGFNKDMTCRGFQFEEGKTYEEPEAKLCEKGFHACENPLDTFRYYEPSKSVYHEVELEDVQSDKNSDDSKVCAKKIIVGARLDVAGLVKAHFDYVTERCEKVDGSAAGDREAVAVNERKSCSAGEQGSASAGEQGSASAGNWGSASAGNWGSASAGYKGSASAGYKGSASAGEQGSASAGEQGSASAGYKGSASAGYKGSASAGYKGSASAGYWGSASAGNWGSASAGYKGSASAGENGLAACRGGRVKGGIGCLLALCEIDNDGNNKNGIAVIVDGEAVKADTWYQLKYGVLVEVGDE